MLFTIKLLPMHPQHAALVNGNFILPIVHTKNDGIIFDSSLFLVPHIQSISKILTLPSKCFPNLMTSHYVQMITLVQVISISVHLLLNWLRFHHCLQHSSHAVLLNKVWSCHFSTQNHLMSSHLTQGQSQSLQLPPRLYTFWSLHNFLSPWLSILQLYCLFVRPWRHY